MIGVSRGGTVRLVAAVGMALSLAALGVASAPVGSAAVRRDARAVAPCANPPLTDLRNPANPLDLPLPPGPDPLHGAHFFVDGPAHGTVAKAIEQLIGDTTEYPNTETWLDFVRSLDSGPLSHLITSPALAQEVRLLEKIGDQEETNKITEYAMGGGPGAIYAETLKINCQNMLADPTPDMVPVFATFFVYPQGVFCPTYRQLKANQRTFKRQINEMAAAQSSRRAVYLLEIDSVGASECMHGATLRLWEYDLRYEIVAMSSLPHTVVFQEAGSSDEGTVSYVAHVLDAICVVRVHRKLVNKCALMRGIWTNGTHFNWSINEIKWARKVSKLLDKLVFAQTRRHYHAYQVVNTAQNGQGPLLNPHPRKQGIEYLCNPRDRGLGRMPTAETAPTFDGYTYDNSWPRAILDAFLWAEVPGLSHGTTCYKGSAPAGLFDINFALQLAANANQQLGPGFPSLPY